MATVTNNMPRLFTLGAENLCTPGQAVDVDDEILSHFNTKALRAMVAAGQLVIEGFDLEADAAEKQAAAKVAKADAGETEPATGKGTGKK